jgi:hypothetical protein
VRAFIDDAGLRIEGLPSMNLVNELQISAESDDVLTVLRKAKRLASKLGRDDIADWLKAEQDGYPADFTVPEYRMIDTRLAYNTNGYIPAGYGYLAKGIQDLPPSGFEFPVAIRDSISSVLGWLAQLVQQDREIYLPVPEGTESSQSIRNAFQIDPRFARQLTFLLHLNSSQVNAIPEHVKDRILDWALGLERAGVIGEGMSFTRKEKQIAHSVTFNIFGSTIEQLNNSGINRRSTR